MTNEVFNIDALSGLQKLPDKSVNCCVTSPPYYGLRDYGVSGQIGLEETPEAYIQRLVDVFREVKRVLHDDGTLWLNIGDSYYGSGKGLNGDGTAGKTSLKQTSNVGSNGVSHKFKSEDLKPKDLIGIPFMLAFALRADGWYWRQNIIWAKKNCMPESVTDRCTRSHEYILMFSKSQKYYYDADAIKEPAIYDVNGTGTAARKARQKEGLKSNPTDTRAGIRAGFKDAEKFEGKHEKQRGHVRRHNGFNDRWDNMTHEEQCTGMRNKRDVWSISPAQFPEAHFATFPEELPAICIKAGCPEDGVVLDTFMGAFTTAVVARKLGRNFIGFELNQEYIKIGEARLKRELGLFI